MEEVSEDIRYTKGKHLFQKGIRFFFILFIVVIAFSLGYERGHDTPDAIAPLSPNEALIINKNSKEKTIDFALFWKVWDLLKEKYVDSENLNAHTLFYGAIKGMLAASGDPYTTFFDPKENKAFEEDISGTFDGIGAEMGIKDDVLSIIAPLEGMPAEKAGLIAGDKVVKIDEQSTTTMTLEEAVDKIRGPRGTEVVLTVFRSGEEEYRTITVKRDMILVKSVRFEMKEGTIAYIRINRFGEDTEREFRDAVKQTLANKPAGLIIDVRNNPGGFLETSLDIASTMLPKGKIIVMEENGKKERKELLAHGGDVLSTLPTIVLINEGSASASEILAGALKDNRDNVTLVGEKSFGKGSVQELIPVGKDTAVKITVARWLTPKGQQINNEGIAPDVEIKLSLEDMKEKRDTQLDKAIEILKKKE